MIKIIPAILPQSLEELSKQLAYIRGTVREVQIDIVDGIFAPNKTWPYEDRLQDSGFRIQELPFADEFDFEIDLMVNESEAAAKFWRAAGAKRIIIHVDAPDARAALMALKFEREEHKLLVGVLAGIALPCSASIEMLGEYENLYDFVQVMGIEKVGFQGQPFDPRAIELVRALRAHYPDLAIQVDGGVSEGTISELVRAGATRLVVGSSIWNSKDPKEKIRKLHELANK